MLDSTRISPLNDALVLSTAIAVEEYEKYGGVLSKDSKFGEDPLLDTAKSSARTDSFMQQFSLDIIFHQLCNGNTLLFEQALQYFIDLTKSLNAS